MSLVGPLVGLVAGTGAGNCPEPASPCWRRKLGDSANVQEASSPLIRAVE
ncbi:hypothetical protein [Arthrobacter methylotrophus]